MGKTSLDWSDIKVIEPETERRMIDQIRNPQDLLQLESLKKLIDQIHSKGQDTTQMDILMREKEQELNANRRNEFIRRMNESQRNRGLSENQGIQEYKYIEQLMEDQRQRQLMEKGKLDPMLLIDKYLSEDQKRKEFI